MDIIKIYDENYFDPTPRLKSSPIPILFVSFNKNDEECIYCGGRYITAILCQQKYCIKCLSCYITDINDNNIYLDLYLYTKNLECSEHEINKMYEPQNIQECCRNCLEILCFKQIHAGTLYISFESFRNLFTNMAQSERHCKLCGKSLYQEIYGYLRLCSDCYLISSGYIESTLTEKPIPIIYLPWWHNITHCDACKISLTFISDCQKYCTNCLIFYTGCRYCLTTNVIFGPTIQSQCKKCKRVSSINFDINNISVGNNYLDDLLSNLRLDIHNNLKITEFADKVKGIDKYFEPYDICDSIYKDVKLSMEWIPYSQFTNIKEIAKGGFDIDKHFLNELKSNQYCYQIKHHIVKTYGFTKDPELDDYILVMQYAKGGDLHNWLQKNFTRITWNKKKLAILWQISEGLETIHKAEFIHRDFHSGNILSSLIDERRYFGMIMWELTTGCKPFANVEHDIQLVYKILDGERPEITEDTPECYANLMKSCWDSDPEKRPTITEIRKTFGKWFFKNKHIEPFDQAEIKRIELINLKKLGPESSEKPHPNAIFTSRPLSFFISKCSSINSSKDYTSLELELDIDIERSKVLGTKRNIEKLNISSHENNGKHIKLYNNI
ncbi:unnamed protein product [Rhizophagus irregularis]|nr:unnamed protein product [Rhizophagus irregularis]